MIRIIAIDSIKADGVSYWRNLRPLTELQRAHPNIQVRFMDEKVSLSDLMQTDLVIMFRPVREESLRFIENVKSRIFNCKLILDIDDNLWRLPPGHPHEIEYTEHAQTLRKIYSMADGIWCSTEAIMPFADAEEAKGKGGRGAVLWPLRYALSGRERSPDPFTIIAILGPSESSTRIQKAIAILAE